MRITLSLISGYPQSAMLWQTLIKIKIIIIIIWLFMIKSMLEKWRNPLKASCALLKLINMLFSSLSWELVTLKVKRCWWMCKWMRIPMKTSWSTTRITMKKCFRSSMKCVKKLTTSLKNSFSISFWVLIWNSR